MEGTGDDVLNAAELGTTENQDLQINQQSNSDGAIAQTNPQLEYEQMDYKICGHLSKSLDSYRPYICVNIQL